MQQVVLVGVGNLGSRYLQGLENITSPVTITVVDPSIVSIDRARSLWSDPGDNAFIDNINWIHDLDKLPTFIDLVIVSTTADMRLSVVTEISTKCLVRYWVLEKVLTQSKSQLSSLNKRIKQAEGVWVNTPRRMMVWYGLLKERFSCNSSMRVERIGSDWGLACNSIHFIDLAAWFSGEQLVSIDVELLSKKWHKSKRPGFYEVFGTLEAIFSSGTKVSLTAEPNGDDFGISITDDRESWVINEDTGTAKSNSGELIGGSLELQSEMTSRLVDGILQTGTCQLTTFQESFHMHNILIEHLLMHWNQANKCNDIFLPVT